MRQAQYPSTGAWLFISVLSLLLGGLALNQVGAQVGAQKPQISVLTTCAKAYYFRGSAKQKLCDAKTLELQNYKLETIKDGRGPLEFPNKTKVTLLGKSVFQITKYDSLGLSGTLVSGQIRYESPKKGVGTDTIEGNKTKLVHIGTTFVFTVGAAPSVKATRVPKSAPITWKPADLQKLKLRDAPKWKTKLGELCSRACSPGVWKPDLHKGTVSLINMKLKGNLQCGCQPEPDADDDSIADRQDSCPKQPGEPSTSPLLNGCPVMVEQVILLPDADGKTVGTVELQEKKTGTVLATLSKAYASAGITAEGEPVLPQVVEPEPAKTTGATPTQPATQQPAPPVTTPAQAPAPASPPSTGTAAPYPGTTAPNPGTAAPNPGTTAPYPGTAAPYSGTVGPGTSGGDISCYWLAPGEEAWEWRPHFTRQMCYENDSCSGGLGQSSGGCYKWAAGPDAPAQASWSALGCPGPNC